MVSQRSALRVSVLAAGLLGASLARAVPIATDFEGFGDLQSLTTQVAGLTFSNTTVLTSGAAGGSLNELDFPPHSGVNVAFDDGGPIEIAFAAPIASFGAYFTYTAKLTLSAYDGLAFLGSVNSLFSSNLAFLGKTPNELVQIDGLGSFTRITIQGDAFGGSFTMDDLTATPAAAVTPVPEPNVLLLVLAGLALLALARRRRSSSH